MDNTDNRETVIETHPDGTTRVRLLPRRHHPSPATLTAVREASAAPTDQRRDALRQAIISARDDGHPVTDIARAATVSRQTIYHQLKSRPASADPQPSVSRR